MNPLNFQLWIALVAAATVISAAVIDYRRRLIPNVITFAAMLAGLVLHGLHSGWSGFTFALTGLAVGGGLLLVFYLIGGMGAGDVKLLAAVGALVGAEKVFAVFVLTVIAGGVMALGQIARHSALKNICSRIKNFVVTLSVKNHFRVDDSLNAAATHTLPYGVAIAIGTLAAFITQ